ncbi:hypothetical protein [Nocardia sp. A7]|uniref:hypothetical protein n=1 Tax=Nocardia sp. A7 TaxID=2789274 RepID=UPI00397BC15D
MRAVIAGPDGPEPPPVRVIRTPRAPVPHRYRVGRHGPLVLMECRTCRAPFHRDAPVPRDLLCRTCRPDDNQLALFDVADADEGTDRDE